MRQAYQVPSFPTPKGEEGLSKGENKILPLFDILIVDCPSRSSRVESSAMTTTTESQKP